MLLPWFEISTVMKFLPVTEIDTFFSQGNMTANVSCFVIKLIEVTQYLSKDIY